MTQASIRPALVRGVHGRRGGPLHFSHERYLMNQIRRRFGFRGTPILLKTRAKQRGGHRKKVQAVAASVRPDVSRTKPVCFPAPSL